VVLFTLPFLKTMKAKIYKKFEAKHINDKWAVITAGEEGIIIATIPTHVSNPKIVANTIAKALSDSDLSVVNPIGGL